MTMHLVGDHYTVHTADCPTEIWDNERDGTEFFLELLERPACTCGFREREAAEYAEYKRTHPWQAFNSMV